MPFFEPGWLCWNIVNSNHRNKLQWNIARNSYIFIQQNAFENDVSEMAAIFSRPQCINRPCAHYRAEFSDWLRRVFWGRIRRGRRQETRLWICLDVKRMCRVFRSEWPSWTWCRTWRKKNQCYFALIRPHLPLMYRYHVILWNQSNSVIVGCSPSWSTDRHLPLTLTVKQFLYSSDCMGPGGRDAKFWFGNIVPKQWTLSGFLQHTSVSAIYIYNNKISQQLQVSDMNKNASTCMMTSSNGNIFRVTGLLCGEFTGPGEFPTQRSVTRSFDVFFDLRLNKRLSKQPWGWWFESPSWSLWRQCNVWHSFQASLLRGPNYCFKCKITVEAHTAYTTPHRLMVYFRFFEQKWEAR